MNTGKDSGKRYWTREQVIRHLTADRMVRDGRASETSVVLAPLSVEVR